VKRLVLMVCMVTGYKIVQHMYIKYQRDTAQKSLTKPYQN